MGGREKEKKKHHEIKMIARRRWRRKGNEIERNGSGEKEQRIGDSWKGVQGGECKNQTREGLRGWGKLVHWRPQSHQLNTLICTKHIHVSTIYGAINRLT